MKADRFMLSAPGIGHTGRVTIAMALMGILALTGCKKDPPDPSGGTGNTTTAITLDHVFDGNLIKLIPSSDGNFIIKTHLTTGNWLMKVDPFGNAVSAFTPVQEVGWWRTFSTIAPTDDGGCMVYVAAGDQAEVQHLDGSGALVSTRPYGFPGYDRPYDMVRNGPTSWMMCGEYQYNTASQGGDTIFMHEEIWVMALDQQGDSLWKRNYPDPSFRHVQKVRPLANGDVLLVSSRSVDMDAREMNAMRISSSSELVWDKDIGPGSVFAACETPSGELMFAGWANVPGDPIPVTMYRTSSSGDAIWEKQFITPGHRTWLGDMVALDNATALLVGYTEPLPPYIAETRLFVACFDEAGDQLWRHDAAAEGTWLKGMYAVPGPGPSANIFGVWVPAEYGVMHWNSFAKRIDADGTFE